MTASILIWVVIALLGGAFFLGRAFQAGRGVPMPQVEGVDPWLAHFREYRASFREESLATVYERWRRLCGYHAAVAAYVATMGVLDPIYAPPGSAVS